MCNDDIVTRIRDYSKSIRVTKNGLIVESGFILCFAGLVVFSCTIFSTMLWKVSGLKRGFCNVTEIQRIPVTCYDTGYLPRVSGYFVYSPTSSEWKHHLKNQKTNSDLQTALSVSHSISRVPSWTHANISQWRSRFYVNMSLNWSSPDSYHRFPYDEMLANCDQYSTIQYSKSQLVPWFPWLHNYVYPVNTTIGMGYRSCELFEPTNKVFYSKTFLSIDYLLILPFIALFVLGTLSVGPITRRGDEPFKSLFLPLWKLIKLIYFVPHAVLCFACQIVGCDLNTWEAFQHGSILFLLVHWYLNFEKEHLKPPAAPPSPSPANSPSPPISRAQLYALLEGSGNEGMRPSPPGTPPETESEREISRLRDFSRMFPELSTAQPPSYCNAYQEGLVIPNLTAPDSTTEIISAPPPSYDEVMSRGSRE